MLKSTGTPPSPPNIEDFASTAAFERARDQGYEVRRDHELAHRSYQLRVAADGSFRVEDVPPGIYELRLSVTEPRKPARGDPFEHGKPVASLTREIVVPTSPPGAGPAEAVDIGDFEPAAVANPGAVHR